MYLRWFVPLSDEKIIHQAINQLKNDEMDARNKAMKLRKYVDFRRELRLMNAIESNRKSIFIAGDFSNWLKQMKTRKLMNKCRATRCNNHELWQT